MEGLLLADTGLPGDLARRSFEWGRVQSPVDWVLPVAATALVLVYVGWLYRRDSVDLALPLRVLLAGLRMAVFVALLVVYLQPQWRNEVDQVQNSRVLLLADTSLSMGLHDQDASAVPAEPSRAQQLTSALRDGDWLKRLRARHDVVVVRFDQDSQRLATLDKQTAQTDNQSKSDDALDWEAGLEPRGTETRLGQALRQWIDAERSSPVSGIVVFSDGQQNAGVDPGAAIGLAREARIPIYTVGLGSLNQPTNVRISDFVAPARAYPGDHYTATGFLQAQGMAGKSVLVELTSRPADAPTGAEGKLEASQQVTLGGDGEVIPIKFDLTPSETGRRTLRLLVRPPASDRNPSDNQQEADVEIVDRKTRVLLFAGGPTREYQFLRNQLRRDRDTIVDVLLQTGAEGISQDAHEILEGFPNDAQTLFAYDAIVAFDPDWRQLSAQQQELVERWVSDQAGGLIVIAGPVYTDGWAQDPATARIRTLYPVEFHRRLSIVGDSHYGSREPWPIEFTRDGLEAEFLWLEDSGPASARAWADFPGVYGHYAVRGPKPGAAVYGWFSDPRAREGDQKPVYLAGQFFGAGRVFYLGSGELWRLRATDDAWFERVYTKLVRHVSQGRLLRGSHRGVLLVERDRYLLGGTVDVRAQLSDNRLQPLEVPRVELEVGLPDSTHQTVPLTADESKKGNYRGQFTVRKEGAYLIELAVPESDERLVRRIQVKVPELEREKPQRNDALLNELATKTGGLYYIGLKPALLGGQENVPPLIEALRDQSRTITTISRPTQLWSNQWTIAILAGALCLEWLLRRLSKLA
ncbi:MAG TPA: vWA domain-containing protein [Pirellulales bacterium]|nr:vWA domain-containing protein [Pirellulales bacterium]